MALRINKNKLAFILIMILLSVSCKKGSFDSSDVDCYTYDYSDCSTTRPYDTELNLLFTINKEFTWVPFEIYKGTVDKGELILRDTAWDNKITYIMPIPETYSVRAIYEINGQTIYAVDGDKLEAASKQICDSTCWSVDITNFDLMLH
jgi:hypothetical protein